MNKTILVSAIILILLLNGCITNKTILASNVSKNQDENIIGDWTHTGDLYAHNTYWFQGWGDNNGATMTYSDGNAQLFLPELYVLAVYFASVYDINVQGNEYPRPDLTRFSGTPEFRWLGINTYDLNVWNDANIGNMYNKEEIHELISGSTFDFFLSDTADGAIGGYNIMYDEDTGEAESTVVQTISADATLIQTYITEAAHPSFSTLSTGIYEVHAHLSATTAGKKTTRVYWELYFRTSGGSEYLIITSEESDILTSSKAAYQFHGNLTNEVDLNSDDRLVLKMYGNLESASGGDPDTTIYMEGTNESRLEVRTTLSVFDDRYLFQDGSKVLTSDWNAGSVKIDIKDMNIWNDMNVGGQATITKMNLGGGLTAFVLNGVSLDAIVGATSQIATELQYVALQHSNVALAGSRFMLSRSRGTLATPLVVQENDSLAALDAAGYDGTDYVLAGQIDFEVDGEPGSNDLPGRIVLKTTADGGILPIARWTVKSTGNLLSGTDGTGDYNILTAGLISGGSLDSAGDGVIDGDLTVKGGHASDYILIQNTTSGYPRIYGNPRVFIDSFSEIIIRSTFGQPMYFDAGGNFEWRDRDDTQEVKMSLNSNTAFLQLITNDSFDPTVSFKTTNTPNQVDMYLDEGSTADVFIIEGKTASQNTDLQVRAPDGEFAYLKLFSGANPSYIYKSSSDNLVFDAVTQDKDILWNVNDGGVTTEVMRIDGSESRVGIGTNAPENKLHILLGGTAIAGAANAALNIQNTAAAGSSVRFQTYSGTAGSFIWDIGDTADADVGQIIYNHQNDYMSLVVNTAERVRITSGGYVGIGTTSPGGLLELNDTNASVDMIIDSGLAGGRPAFYLKNDTDDRIGYYYYGSTYGADTDLRNDLLMLADNASSDLIMRFNNVGIGLSSTPAYKLDVGGTFRATNTMYSNQTLKVTGSSTPTGIGPELRYTGGEAELLAYNRTTPGYLTLKLRGSKIELVEDAVDRLVIDGGTFSWMNGATLLSTINQTGDFNTIGSIRTHDYISGDGTSGMTGTCADGTDIVFKDGLAVSCA